MTTFPETNEELRADAIQKGDVIEESGMDAYRVGYVRMHGDTVLLKGAWLVLDDNRKVIDRYLGETTIDRDDMVMLLYRRNG